MPKRLSRKHEDAAQSAFRALAHVIESTEKQEPAKPARPTVVPMRPRKNPAAVALGRKGGQNSAKGRMEKIAPEERRRIASAAARARWKKEKGDD
jgi:hypothetical protein